MKRKQLRVGIAGYGIVGKKRRQIIDEHPDLVTVAICDQNYTQPCTADDGVQCYPNYRPLLEEPLDVMFVSLPNYLAPEVTIAGLERGLHVFCEKPPGRTVNDIESVIAVEQKHPKLKLKYGFNHRYHDSVREALRVIRLGEMGDVINLRGVYGKSKITPFTGNWRAERRYAGGGILLDQGIHMVDLMRLFCDEIVEIKSFVDNGFWNCDVEDNAYVLMRDKKGRFGMLHSSATQWQHSFKLEISLQEGYVNLHGILAGTKSYGEEKLLIGRRTDSITGSEREETITFLEDNSWRDEIYEFADGIVNGSNIKNGNSQDALATMKLVYAIYYADPEWRKKFRIDNPY